MEDQVIIIIAKATSHQGDITHFGTTSVGRQCVPNCVACIAYAQNKNFDKWTHKNMDIILKEGDRLYQEIYDNMVTKQDYFLLEDIPQTFLCFNQNWIFSICNEVDVGLKGKDTEDIKEISNSISTLFEGDACAIMLLGSLTYASASVIVKKSNTFYIFDPHSRSDDYGMPVSDGHAILGLFQQNEELVLYILQLSKKLFATDLSISLVSLSNQGTGEAPTKNQTVSKNIDPEAIFSSSSTTLPSTRVTRSMSRTLVQNNPFIDAGANSLNSRTIPIQTNNPVAARVKKCRQNAQYKQHEQKKNHERITKLRENSTFVSDARLKNKQRMQLRRREQKKMDEQSVLSTPLKTGQKRKKPQCSTEDSRYNSTPENEQIGCDNTQSNKKRRRNLHYQHIFREKQTEETRKTYLAADAQRKSQKRKASTVQINEGQKREQKNYGNNLEQSISIFHDVTSQGPIYVCTSCLQTMFVDDVDKVANLRPGKHKALLKECCTGYISIDGCEWLCHSCKYEIYQDQYPKLSKANKVYFPEKPEELNLYPLEETLISPLLPFMTIRSLPVGGLTKEGQKMIIGNVVHVPNDISSTVRILPRNLDDMGTIPVKLKRRKQQKTAVFQENIRPAKTLSALKWLLRHSDLYKNLQIQINEEHWLQDLENGRSDNRSFVEGQVSPMPLSEDTETDTTSTFDDCFEEIPAHELTQGNTDTMLEEYAPMQIYQEAELQALHEEKRQPEDAPHDKVYSVAPGENQVPVFRDEMSEYRCFPTIFCGQTRPSNDERHRSVYLSEIYKAELRNVDPRVALNIPNIFYKAKILQIKSVIGRINLALRRVVGAKHQRLTAGDLLDADTRDNIRRLDEGYRIFRSLRNSPPYFEAKKKELNAMIRQLGYPTFFFSLSSADTKWPHLIRCLGKLVEQKDYTLDYIQKEMTTAHRTRLVSAHPAACCRYFNHRVQKFLRLVVMGPHSPFGKVKDFFYRMEFQKRGSPHIHGFLWIDNSPRIDKASNEEICSYIDQHISCSSALSEQEKQYVMSQKHSHSKSCKRMNKNKATCRFGAPWPPMPKTIILEPLQDISDEERCNLQKKYGNIIRSIDKLPKDITTFEEWLHTTRLSYDEYIRLVQSNIERKKVFLQRNPHDTRINSYMKHLIGAWQANHDIQFVFDPYQCVSYICDYMTKSQKGMSELMQAATQEAREGNLELKKAVQHIGNKMINASEASAQQCACDILQIPITNSSRAKEFINTSRIEERVSLVKSLKVLENMKPQSKDIAHLSNIDRYAMRPKVLDNWCLAEYVAKTDIKYIRNANSTLQAEDDPVPDPEREEAYEQDAAYEEGDGFPFTLRSGHLLRKRRHRKIIRFKTYSQKSEPEDYYRVQLLLYTAWRKENLLQGTHKSMESAYYAKETEILENKRDFEPNSRDLDAAYEEYYQAQRSNKITEENDNIDDTDDLPVAEHDFPVLERDDTNPQHRIDIGPELGIAPTLNDQDVQEYIDQEMSKEEYFALLKTLNQKQQEIHAHIVHQIKEAGQQLLVALHGGAGTGKSTVIKAISQGVQYILRQEVGTDFTGPRVLLTAPTGKAAYNIKGLTIHRAFYIPADQKMEYKPLKWDSLSRIQNTFRGIKIIIIDEFSMVGARLLRFIHLRLQEVCGNQLPFGGMNILMCGDLYQLKPVRDCWIFENIDNAYGSLAPNLFQDNFVFFELDEIMRQKDDKLFAELLNRIRIGTYTSDDLVMLHSAKITETQSRIMLDVPHFFTVNAAKDEFNTFVLENTEGKCITITAVDHVSSDVPKSEQKKILYAAMDKKTSACGNLPYQLVVKEGVQYDITANVNASDGIVNGAECIIKHISQLETSKLPTYIWVQFRHEEIGKQTRKNVTGLNIVYTQRGWTPVHPIQRQFVASRSNILVTRKQFPLQLSAARTIHKAQSATYDKIVLNMSVPPRTPKVFMEHIHYVGLSRARTFKGISVIDLNTQMIRISPKVEKFLQTARKMVTLCYQPTYQCQTSLRIIYNNVGSLPMKWHALENNQNIQCADIFFIAETWLSDKHNAIAYQLENFTQIRMDSKYSSDVQHRGMLMYIKKDWIMENIQLYQTANIEIMTCIFHLNRYQRIIVAGVYKPPKTNYSALQQEISTFMETVSVNTQVVLMGDFNINILDTKNARFVTKMEQTYHFKQIVSQASTWAGTLIDLIFTNVSTASAYALTTTWSPHHLICVHIPM